MVARIPIHIIPSGICSVMAGFYVGKVHSWGLWLGRGFAVNIKLEWWKRKGTTVVSYTN